LDRNGEITSAPVYLGWTEYTDDSNTEQHFWELTTVPPGNVNGNGANGDDWYGDDGAMLSVLPLLLTTKQCSLCAQQPAVFFKRILCADDVIGPRLLDKFQPRMWSNRIRPEVTWYCIVLPLCTTTSCKLVLRRLTFARNNQL
jgi:hypothetical protein